MNSTPSIKNWYEANQKLIITIVPFAFLAVLVVGLVIGILQAATSVQEYTLTFVPKVLVVFGIMLVLGPFGLSRLQEFTVRMLTLIPELTH